jgi:hypothetical protein
MDAYQHCYRPRSGTRSPPPEPACLQTCLARAQCTETTESIHKKTDGRHKILLEKLNLRLTFALITPLRADNDGRAAFQVRHHACQAVVV